MAVFTEIIDCTDVKSSSGSTAVRAAENDGCGLMEYLAADSQLPGHLPLQQPAEKPVITIERIVAVIDPVTATAVGRPIAEALLNPQREVCAHVAGANATALASGGKLMRG